VTTWQGRHEVVTEILRKRIVSGVLKPRCQISSQSEMTEEFKVSARTIGHAVASLRERNHLRTLPYRESYAQPPGHWQGGTE
jgi:DNA-binding GntR family transcriptional regulator